MSLLFVLWVLRKPVSLRWFSQDLSSLTLVAPFPSAGAKRAVRAEQPPVAPGPDAWRPPDASVQAGSAPGTAPPSPAAALPSSERVAPPSSPPGVSAEGPSASRVSRLVPSGCEVLLRAPSGPQLFSHLRFLKIKAHPTSALGPGSHPPLQGQVLTPQRPQGGARNPGRSHTDDNEQKGEVTVMPAGTPRELFPVPRVSL